MPPVDREDEHEGVRPLDPLLAPFATGGTITDATMHAVLGAADGVARAMAHGQIDDAAARTALERIIAAAV
ncbi:hypothetical protein [Patulibacter minatonensis]|uniref:hypothetical protein n=1 Tax=Patulibacter minatonensis TaxID=298163 RepID=UPI001B7FD7B8|nr:hypothetical protein [Patulibacter minatonensis]